jgi:cell wall-associated NlpC family hydrolase
MPDEETGGAPARTKPADPAIAGEAKNEAPFTTPVVEGKGGQTKPGGSAIAGEAKNEAPFTTAVASPTPSVRDEMVKWANWGIANHALFDYTEGPERMSMIHLAPGETTQRISADCSGFATGCAKWAGAPDPNNQHFDGQGYTGTMLEYCKQITLAQVRPGDLVVYGPPPGHHVCIVIGLVEEGGKTVDLQLSSHGEQGDPHEVLHSVEQEYQPTPATFLSFIP